MSQAAKIKVLQELGFEPAKDNKDTYVLTYGEGTKNPQRVTVDVVKSQYTNRSNMLFTLRQLMEQARKATQMVQTFPKPKDQAKKEGGIR